LFAAIAVQERTRLPVPKKSDRQENYHAVRHLERLPQGTLSPETGALPVKRFANWRSPFVSDATYNSFSRGSCPCRDYQSEPRLRCRASLTTNTRVRHPNVS
jgi:hypothetical protein